MRKSRLKILPARCLSRLGFLLLYLSCPVIGDTSRTRPRPHDDQALRHLSGPEKLGDEDANDDPGRRGSTDGCRYALTSTCETSDNEWEHCVWTARNHTDTSPDTSYNTRLQREPSTGALPGSNAEERDPSPVVPLAAISRSSRRDSSRRVSTNVYQTRKKWLRKPASNEHRVSVGVESETRQTRQRMLRVSSSRADLKPFRLSEVATKRLSSQRRSRDVADERRASRQASAARRRSDDQSVARRTAAVRSGTRAQELGRTTRNNRFSGNRRSTRYDAKLASTETRREVVAARRSSKGNGRFSGGNPNARSIRATRRLVASAPNTRRLQLAASPRRRDSANVYRNARIAVSTDRRLSYSRSIRFNADNAPKENVLTRSVSRERSASRRVSVNTVKVPSLRMEALMSETDFIKPRDKRSMSKINSTDDSIMMSQDVFSFNGNSDTNFDMKSAPIDGYANRKLSTGILKTLSLVRGASLVRRNSKGLSDSRRMRMSRITNNKLYAKIPMTRRLVRAVPTARRNVLDVSNSRRSSRDAFKNRRISNDLSEMRRNAHEEFQTRRYSEDIHSKRSLSRARSANGRLSTELATRRTVSRETLSRKSNHIAVHSGRRLSLATASSRRASVGISSLSRRQGEFLAAKRLTRKSSLIRNSFDTSDSRRTLSSRSSDTRRKIPVDIIHHRRIATSRSSNARLPIEQTQRRRLVRSVSLTRGNARVSYPSKMSELSNKFYNEQTEIRSLVRETPLARKLSPGSVDKRSNSRTAYGSRVSLALHETKRKAYEHSLERQYSAEGRVSRGQFRVASMNPTLIFALHRTRMSSRQPFDIYSRRALLVPGEAKTSRVDSNRRRSIMGISRKNSLDTGLLSRQRFVSEEKRERMRSLATRSSKFAVINSANGRFSSKASDSRKLSVAESTRRNILADELRTSSKSSGRFIERRLSPTLSKARTLIQDVQLSRRNSVVTTERRAQITKKAAHRQYPSYNYVKKVSSVGLFSRGIRTERQSIHRKSVTRRYQAHDFGKRRIASVRSGNTLHFSRRLQDAFKTRRHFENGSRRRFDTASQRRLNTASTVNRRLLLRNYMEALSAKRNVITTARRNAVHSERTIRKATFGNRVFSPQLPSVGRVPKFRHEAKNGNEDSTKPVFLGQMHRATRISKYISPQGENMTAIDDLGREHCFSNFDRVMNPTDHYFNRDGHMEYPLTTNIYLARKTSQLQTTNFSGRQFSSSNDDTSTRSEWHKNNALFSNNCQLIEVPKYISTKEASVRENEDAATIVTADSKRTWYSAAARFGRELLSTWLKSLSVKLSSTQSELYLGKFYSWKFEYETFQGIKEQISQPNIMQMMRNALLPEAGYYEKSATPPPNDKTGPGLVSGGVVGTALLLTAATKFK